MSKKGFYILEENLSDSHKCNDNCNISRLVHYCEPVVTLNVVKWHDFGLDVS